VVNEDTGELHLAFGNCAKTNDFIVDCLSSWWEFQSPDERDGLSRLQIKADNGPQGNGRRTQFLKRMVDFADHIGKPIQLLYYPPYHSQYNPVGRCWGSLEQHWNGAKLVDAHARVGKGHDLEGYPPGRAIESQRLPKRHLPLQKGHASGGGSARTRSHAA
jgi:hypothetical protein